MATVLHLKPLYRAPAAPPLESVAQRRVRRGSQAAVWLFTGLFVLAAAILATAIGVMLFYKGELVRIGPDNCYIGEARPIRWRSDPCRWSIAWPMCWSASSAPRPS